MVSKSNPHRVLVGYGVIVNEDQGDDVCVARVSGDGFDDDNGDAILANALLIAASPEMLSLLRAITQSTIVNGCVNGEPVPQPILPPVLQSAALRLIDKATRRVPDEENRVMDAIEAAAES